MRAFPLRRPWREGPRPRGTAVRRPRPGHCAGIPRRTDWQPCAKRSDRARVDLRKDFALPTERLITLVEAELYQGGRLIAYLMSQRREDGANCDLLANGHRRSSDHHPRRMELLSPPLTERSVPRPTHLRILCILQWTAVST